MDLFSLLYVYNSVIVVLLLLANRMLLTIVKLHPIPGLQSIKTYAARVICINTRPTTVVYRAIIHYDHRSIVQGITICLFNETEFFSGNRRLIHIACGQGRKKCRWNTLSEFSAPQTTDALSRYFV